MRKTLVIATILSSILYSANAVAENKPKHKWVGLGLDVGVPDGGAAGLVVSPYFDWLKVSGSYTNNYFTSGGRFGLTLDPINFGVAPTFTTEYGFSGKFNPSDIVGEKLPTANYQYVNLQPGLEFGSRNGFRFFLRAGFTHLWTNSYNFQEVISSNNLSITDPKAKLWLYPTFKLGFQVLVF